MTAEIKNGKLIITIDLQAPTLSASGKTYVVASTRGNVATTAVVKGQPVIIGLNAYVKKTAEPIETEVSAGRLAVK